MSLMDPAPDVLVVDDNPAVSRLLVTALRRAGWQVEAAEDGQAALQVLRRAAPRLVLAARALPGLGGLDLLEQLEASGRSVPFLLMSAFLSPERRLAVLDTPGVTGLLEKPFDLDRLLDDVRASLALGASRDAQGRAQGLVSEARRAQIEAVSPLESPQIDAWVAGQRRRNSRSAAQAWFPGGTSGSATGGEPSGGCAQER